MWDHGSLSRDQESKGCGSGKPPRDHSGKINGLLCDETIYLKITDRRKNPTTSTETFLNKLLLQIKEKQAPHDSSRKQLDPKLYCKLHSTDATPASFYGLHKIHKVEVPLRPIMSATESPTYSHCIHN